VGVTLAIAVASHLLPESSAATAVGAGFLVAGYVWVLRLPDADAAKNYGLSFGGLRGPEPLDGRRLVGSVGAALGWASLWVLLTFPPFWVGFYYWYEPSSQFFSTIAWLSFADQALGQLTMVALPEEAFYRGYLQTALDKAWPPRTKILGARVGPGLLVAAVLFAVGHVLTQPFVTRLAVFFPALVFGCLRARTGGVGAGIVYHAACNLFASYLGQSYGLFS
jgi:membrane protease YdiL (CAAX protease family)